jgi:hypothetical protein
MKSSRQIEKIVGRARAKAGRATDERILTDAGVALTNSSHNRPKALRPGPTIWRFIMENKITRYSAAAVIALTLILVLLNPFGTSKNSGIVWAEVAQKVGEARTVTHKMKRLAWKPGEEGPSYEVDVIKYASSDFGLVEEQYDKDGRLMHRVYFLKEQNKIVIVFPDTKKYIKFSISEDYFNRLTKLTSPQGLVDYVTSGQYTELGRGHFDGFEVYGFEIKNVDLSQIPKEILLIFPVTNLTGRIWVDVETSLPVGIEMDLNIDRGLFTGFQELRAEFIGYDIQWNAELPEGIFEPNIPDDYTEFKVTDFIPAEVKAGLVGLGIIPAGFIVWRRLRRKKSIVSQN